MKEIIKRDEPDQLIAYVDGSYDDSIKRYAYGCVYIKPDGEIETEYGGDSKEDVLVSRNVSGEMIGAMRAAKWCEERGYGSLRICYDYEGIEKWVTGEWKTKKELTKKYAEYMRRRMERIRITFLKVAAHTGDMYNEMADRLAKKGLISEGNGSEEE